MFLGPLSECIEIYAAERAKDEGGKERRARPGWGKA